LDREVEKGNRESTNRVTVVFVIPMGATPTIDIGDDRADKHRQTAADDTGEEKGINDNGQGGVRLATWLDDPMMVGTFGHSASGEVKWALIIPSTVDNVRVHHGAECL